MIFVRLLSRYDNFAYLEQTILSRNNSLVIGKLVGQSVDEHVLDFQVDIGHKIPASLHRYYLLSVELALEYLFKPFDER